jgi:hypothetical protein
MRPKGAGVDPGRRRFLLRDLECSPGQNLNEFVNLPIDVADQDRPEI